MAGCFLASEFISGRKQTGSSEVMRGPTQYTCAEVCQSLFNSDLTGRSMHFVLQK